MDKMQLIDKEDFDIRKQENFDRLNKGEKMWIDKDKLLLEATIEVLTEKINVLVVGQNWLSRQIHSHKEK